jgi:hypothetical protein
VGKEEGGQKAIATNRKAFFNYEVLDRAELDRFVSQQGIGGVLLAPLSQARLRLRRSADAAIG